VKLSLLIALIGFIGFGVSSSATNKDIFGFTFIFGVLAFGFSVLKWAVSLLRTKPEKVRPEVDHVKNIQNQPLVSPKAFPSSDAKPIDQAKSREISESTFAQLLEGFDVFDSPDDQLKIFLGELKKLLVSVETEIDLDIDDEEAVVRSREYLNDAELLISNKSKGWHEFLELCSESSTDLRSYLENEAEDQEYLTAEDFLESTYMDIDEAIKSLIEGYCLHNAEYEYSQISFLNKSDMKFEEEPDSGSFFEGQEELSFDEQISELLEKEKKLQDEIKILKANRLSSNVEDKSYLELIRSKVNEKSLINDSIHELRKKKIISKRDEFTQQELQTKKEISEHNKELEKLRQTQSAIQKEILSRVGSLNTSQPSEETKNKGGFLKGALKVAAVGAAVNVYNPPVVIPKTGGGVVHGVVPKGFGWEVHFSVPGNSMIQKNKLTRSTSGFTSGGATFEVRWS